MTGVNEQELKAHQKNIGGKRVTLEGVEANIKATDFVVHPGTCLTICILTLQNGYTVTGESACADPSMFNAEIGQRIAKDNAVKKIWPLMGYALRQELYEAELATGEPQDWKTRLRAEAEELEQKLIKLQTFIGGSVQFKGLMVEQRNQLVEQRDIMVKYLDILKERLI